MNMNIDVVLLSIFSLFLGSANGSVCAKSKSHCRHLAQSFGALHLYMYLADRSYENHFATTSMNVIALLCIYIILFFFVADIANRSMLISIRLLRERFIRITTKDPIVNGCCAIQCMYVRLM